MIYQGLSSRKGAEVQPRFCAIKNWTACLNFISCLTNSIICAATDGKVRIWDGFARPQTWIAQAHIGLERDLCEISFDFKIGRNEWNLLLNNFFFDLKWGSQGNNNLYIQLVSDLPVARYSIQVSGTSSVGFFGHYCVYDDNLVSHYYLNLETITGSSLKNFIVIYSGILWRISISIHSIMF